MLTFFKSYWQLITSVVLAAVIAYFCYDYGYTKGVETERLKFDEFKAVLDSEVKAQKAKVSELEQNMAERARSYEKLQTELTAKQKEAKKWKDRVEREKCGFSADAVQYLNSLLGVQQ